MAVSITKGESRQDLGTPWDLIRAIEKRWGPLAWDLAADHTNTKAPRYLSKRIDSLKQDWTELLRGENGWLNPEFNPVTPWINHVVRHYQQGAKLITLTRGSIDANWYWRIEPIGNIYVLSPRPAFLNQRDKKTGRILEPHELKVYASAIIITTFNIEPKNEKMQLWKWKASSGGESCATTVATSTKTAGSASSLLAQAKTSCYSARMQTPYSSGASSLMTADSRA